METWIIPGLYLLLYTLFHSLLAAAAVKTRIARLLGRRMAFYRFGYTLLSLLLLVPIPLLPFPRGGLYHIPPPWAWGVRALQALALLGFFWALRAIDLSEFLGLSQIRRYRMGVPLPETRDEVTDLITRGPYRFCRHPLYAAASLGLLAQPHVTRAYALLAGWALLYFWIGSHIEERRLLRQFGDAYQRYRSTTPRFLPTPRRTSHPSV